MVARYELVAVLRDGPGQSPAPPQDEGCCGVGAAGGQLRKNFRACEYLIANPKAQVTLRLDQGLLAAIRASGGGWQTRVNQTLRKTFVRAAKRRTGS
jgi:hypothetical protein